MFNFTTNVIINSADQIALLDATGTATTAAATGASAPKLFRIKRYRDFKIGDPTEVVKGAYKAVGYNKVLSKATINEAALTALVPTTNGAKNLARLNLYVKLQGSNNPMFANPFVQKGKPFGFEFVVKYGDSASDVADKIIASLKKIQSMLLNDDIVTVTKVSTPGANSTTITSVEITAVNEFEKFTNVDLELYVEDPTFKDGAFENSSYVEKVTNIDPRTGTVSAVVSYFSDRNVKGSATIASPKIEVAQGIEGFGTFDHLRKDYRLPTAENGRWLRIDEDNYPIKGTIYNQYTIKVETDRGITGQSVVGQPGTSITTHIFWVPQSLASTFEAGLGLLGWTGNVAAGLGTNTYVAPSTDHIADDTELAAAGK
jgi:hypothetical protein